MWKRLMRRLFALIFFKVYRNHLETMLEESYQEEVAYYDDPLIYPKPLTLEEKDEIVMYQGCFSELHAETKRAKNIYDLTRVEDDFSENLSHGALPQILYELDRWLEEKEHVVS